MADYYPLIARAVAGLEKNTGENRRALYERARTALVAQLRGVSPALDESEITRERLALEEAIRKIEAEAARQAREAQRPAPAAPKRPEPPATPPPPPRPSALPGSDNTSSSPPRRERSASGSLSDEAMKGFREVASSPAPQPAASQPAPTARRPEEPRRERPPLFTPPQPPQPGQGGTAARPRPPVFDPPSARTDAGAPASPPYADPPAAPAPLDYDAPRPATPRARPPAPPAFEDDTPEVAHRPVRPVSVRSYRGPIRIGAAVLILLLAAGMLYWQRETISNGMSSLFAMFGGGSSTATRDPGPSAPTRPKITDRIGQPGTATQPAGAPAVAQRVVLYEEDPDDPQGKRLVGTAVWRTEMLPAAPGRAAEMAIRADVEIPDRKMSMTWSLRRNTDPALPASHTIEIMFNIPADAPGGGVQNVPGVLMKQAEQTRGVPLAGLAVKVTPGFFLIGLSSLETDVQRNLALLKERSWFDIPIVYNNNRRAILALEKGTPGERAFNEAFATWKQ